MGWGASPRADFAAWVVGRLWALCQGHSAVELEANIRVRVWDILIFLLSIGARRFKNPSLFLGKWG